jgi:hypothetical protein
MTARMKKQRRRLGTFQVGKTVQARGGGAGPHPRGAQRRDGCPVPADDARTTSGTSEELADARLLPDPALLSSRWRWSRLRPRQFDGVGQPADPAPRGARRRGEQRQDARSPHREPMGPLMRRPSLKALAAADSPCSRWAGASGWARETQSMVLPLRHRRSRGVGRCRAPVPLLSDGAEERSTVWPTRFPTSPSRARSNRPAAPRRVMSRSTTAAGSLLSTVHVRGLCRVPGQVLYPVMKAPRPPQSSHREPRPRSLLSWLQRRVAPRARYALLGWPCGRAGGEDRRRAEAGRGSSLESPFLAGRWGASLD